jgi:hypothetical protein
MAFVSGLIAIWLLLLARKAGGERIPFPVDQIGSPSLRGQRSHTGSRPADRCRASLGRFAARALTERAGSTEAFNRKRF